MYKYSHFIPQNIAPKGVSKIGVYDSNNNKITTIPLGGLTPPKGEKLYSFGLVSDIHLYPPAAVEWKPEKKFRHALNYFQTNDCALTIVSGDLTNTGFYRERTLEDGTKEKYYEPSQMMEYKNIREEFTMPTYALCGNHESYNKNVTETLDDLENVIGIRELSFSVSSLEPSTKNMQLTTIGNDVFILCGQPNPTSVMSDSDFQWLTETLEANKTKRCFIFVHAYIEEDSGDAMDVRENSIFDYWGKTKTSNFINLLKQYNNVILFHGHSHMKFMNQQYDKYANYTDKNGFKSVHVPSLATPRNINFDTMESVNDNYASEGYIVDVYKNYIVLNGMDFINNRPIPLGTFKIDTIEVNTEISKPLVDHIDYLNTAVNADTYNDMNLKSIVITSAASIGDNTFVNHNELETIKLLKADTIIADNAIPYKENLTIYGIDGSTAQTYANNKGINFITVETSDISASDSDNVFSYYDEENTTLYICGEGTMKGWNLFTSGSRPWSSYVSNITSCIFSNNILNIGKWFLASATNLTFIHMSNTTINVEDGAFGGCSNLESVTFPDTVITIDGFYNCKKLSSVTLSKNLEVLDGAFQNCTALESIILPNKLNRINSATFQNCTSLKTITIPNSVTFIGYDAFSDSGLTSIIIPDSVTTLGQQVFWGCENLLEVSLSKVLSEIATGAFGHCYLLQNVIIPDSVKTIQAKAFYYCKALQSITIPESVTSIKDNAFVECITLTEITILNSSTTISDGAISPQEGLTIYGLSGSTAQTYANNNGINFIALDGEITPPDDGEDNLITYDVSDTSKDNVVATLNLNTGVMTISGTGRMYDWFWDGEENVPWHEFRENIVRCDINEGITNIGGYAFCNCINLTILNIPSSLQSVDADSFANTGFIELDFSDTNLQYIDYAFPSCSKLTTIKLPSTLPSMSDAFDYCSNLTHVYFDGSKSSFLLQIKEKGYDIMDQYWDSYTGEYTVYCNNGNLTKAEVRESIN